MIRLTKILNEAKVNDLNEGKVTRNLKSLKVKDFPPNWTLKDVIDRYDDQIWEYFWYEQGYIYDFGK